MYSTDPEWCNYCDNHVGPLECMDCLQRHIGDHAERLMLAIAYRWNRWDIFEGA